MSEREKEREIEYIVKAAIVLVTANYIKSIETKKKKKKETIRQKNL